MLTIFLICLLTIICILVIIAFFTVAERKVLASIQRRRGPNVVGIYGLGQGIADGIKLLGKEIIIPAKANLGLFFLAPIITFTTSLINWGFLPVSSIENIISNKNLAFLYIFAVSSVGIYGIILSGWSSNSRYAFIGAIRSTSQMISYEVSLGLLIMPVILCVGSFNFGFIGQFQLKTLPLCFLLFPLFFLFLISILAETNRTPFDLPEAEAELVSGYNIEYSSLIFALFFLGEYSNMFVLSMITAITFFSSNFTGLFTNIFIFTFIINIFAFFFIFIRSSLPRYRYDQLLLIGWEVILPVSISYLIFVSGFIRFLV